MQILYHLLIILIRRHNFALNNFQSFKRERNIQILIIKKIFMIMMVKYVLGKNKSERRKFILRSNGNENSSLLISVMQVFSVDMNFMLDQRRIIS